LKKTRLQSVGLACMGAVTALYFIALDRYPRMVGGDEAHFATHAYSIATTGRDLNGEVFPFFVSITDPLVPEPDNDAWYQPFLFYVLAAVFQVLPVAVWSIRLPVAAIAAINILLVYAIGRRLFGRVEYAVIAALFLGMTPALFIMTRHAGDEVGPVAFVLGWLWCLCAYRDTPRRWPLVLSGTLLGIGTFTYIAAWALMPLLLAITVLVLLWDPQTRRQSWLPLAGYAPPMAVGALAFARHPEILLKTMTRYFQNHPAAAAASPLAGAAADQLTPRLSVYWSQFNPSFLFFAGGSSPSMSTSIVGVFLTAISVFFVVGLVLAWSRRSRTDVLLLAGVLVAPLPVVISLPESLDYNPMRILVLLPLVAILATMGLEWLWRRPGRHWRVVSIALLLTMPLQFARFVQYYFDGYQERAAFWIDPMNTGAIMDYVIARDAESHVPAVYWRENLKDTSIRWKFFTLKHRRPDLWARTIILMADPPDPKTVPSGSLMVLYASDPLTDRLVTQGGYTIQTTIFGIDGQANMKIVRRDP
jgi:4-amino-4-deoxy-L-arabinose transferase-like glycosyltransferase